MKSEKEIREYRDTLTLLLSAGLVEKGTWPFMALSGELANLLWILEDTPEGRRNQEEVDVFNEMAAKVRHGQRGDEKDAS